jgi:F0F1-type ATP synthase assembly protein I
MIGGMTYLGHLADERWGLTPWMSLAGCLLGLTLGIYDVMRQMSKPVKRDGH